VTRDDIIRMAREAGFQDHGVAEMWGHLTASKGHIERFAALVAAHALANIDPSKLMSYQEGYEAGRTAEREACAQEIREVRECIWDGLDGVIKETARNVCDNIIIRVQARGEKK
jgi:hypothetical protein